MVKKKYWILVERNFLSAKTGGVGGIKIRNERGEKSVMTAKNAKCGKRAAVLVRPWLGVGQSWSKQTHSFAECLICSTMKH